MSPSPTQKRPTPSTVNRRYGKGYKLTPRETKPVPPGALWITARQVLDRYGGRNEMWLWREVKHNPAFPKPRYQGRLRIFSVAEFDAYDRALLSERVGGGS